MFFRLPVHKARLENGHQKRKSLDSMKQFLRTEMTSIIGQDLGDQSRRTKRKWRAKRKSSYKDVRTSYRRSGEKSVLENLVAARQARN